MQNKKGIMYLKHRYKLTKNTRCLLFFLILFTAFNVLSWNSVAFTDWYRLHVFPVWTGSLGRVSDLFSGSLGEALIVAGICYVLAGIVLLPLFIWKKFKKNKGNGSGRTDACPGDSAADTYVQLHPEENSVRMCRKTKQRHTVGWWYMRILCWILIYIYGTETLNCYILYHASPVEEQYYDPDSSYGSKELTEVYTIVVSGANALAGQIRRDRDGQPVYPDSVQELYQACQKAMKAQGKRYPYLSGYYPDPKPVRASRFMSQQYLLGIYFPFTMEANYNTVMYPVNVPATICHEFAHLKGIILEDEANYFGFVACTESDDPYLQYSGYLSVLGYLSAQVRASVPEKIRKKLVQPDPQVLADDIFLTEKQWEQVEEKALLPTETVSQATDTFLNTTLTINGVEDGIRSYSRVVRLLIHYYMDSGVNRERRSAG